MKKVFIKKMRLLWCMAAAMIWGCVINTYEPISETHLSAAQLGSLQIGDELTLGSESEDLQWVVIDKSESLVKLISKYVPDEATYDEAIEKLDEISIPNIDNPNINIVAKLPSIEDLRGLNRDIVCGFPSPEHDISEFEHLIFLEENTYETLYVGERDYDALTHQTITFPDTDKYLGSTAYFLEDQIDSKTVYSVWETGYVPRTGFKKDWYNGFRPMLVIEIAEK